MMFPRGPGTVLFGLMSFWVLKEFITLLKTRAADHKALVLSFASIPVQFWWVYRDWYGMFVIFIPVYVFLAIPVLSALENVELPLLYAGQSHARDKAAEVLSVTADVVGEIRDGRFGDEEVSFAKEVRVRMKLSRKVCPARGRPPIYSQGIANSMT